MARSGIDAEWCNEGEWADEAVIPRKRADPGAGGMAPPMLLDPLELLISIALAKVGEGWPESGRDH